MNGMKDKLKISLPIIVEGRYDKIKIESIAEARVLTTDGFGIFNAAEKRALFRRLAEKGPVILLTDPDGAGRLIRSHLRGVLPPDRIIDLYVPEVKGKERRKKEPSGSGLLGVEGTDADRLRALLAPFADGGTVRAGERITKADLYADGLSGGKGSAEKRARLARILDLPAEMSANSLIAAINLICAPGDYRRAVETLNKEEENG